jgi:exonuclease III
MLTNTAKNSLIDWKPISERLMMARFKAKVRNVTVIQCYAPTEGSEIQIKEAFYHQLSEAIRKTPRKDVIIVMSDLNAKVGSNNEGLEHIMGKHGLGYIHENGEMFTDLCAKHDLVIGGTIFPHRRCHKVTWVSPDHNTENQIDHVAVSRKFSRSLLNVRNKRGADINSDHHLVIADFRMRILANTK